MQLHAGIFGVYILSLRVSASKRAATGAAAAQKSWAAELLIQSRAVSHSQMVLQPSWSTLGLSNSLRCSSCMETLIDAPHQLHRMHP